MSRDIFTGYIDGKNNTFLWGQEMIGHFQNPHHKININFIDANLFPIWNAPLTRFADPVIVQYKNGLLEILPKNLTATSVREYLGYRSTQIIYWGVVPGLNSTHNPSYDPDKKALKVNSLELYDAIHGTAR